MVKMKAGSVPELVRMVDRLGIQRADAIGSDERRRPVSKP